MGGWWWPACVPCAVLLCQRRRWGLSIDNPMPYALCPMPDAHSLSSRAAERGGAVHVGGDRSITIEPSGAQQRDDGIRARTYLHPYLVISTTRQAQTATRMRAIGCRSSPSIGRPLARVRLLVGFLKGLLGSGSVNRWGKDRVGVPCTCVVVKAIAHSIPGCRLNEFPRGVGDGRS